MRKLKKEKKRRSDKAQLTKLTRPYLLATETTCTMN